MTQEETYGTRDMSYSKWHRRESTQRFIGMESAQLLAMIDLDVCLYTEYDDKTKEPIVLIEVAMDVGQSDKASTVTRKLAERAGVPGYVVLYKLSYDDNPGAPGYKDIEQFRIKRVHPKPEREWRKLSPAEYANGLLKMREWSSKRIEREMAENIPL